MTYIVLNLILLLQVFFFFLNNLFTRPPTMAAESRNEQKDSSMHVPRVTTIGT